jgi:hypothetical protein
MLRRAVGFFGGAAGGVLQLPARIDTENRHRDERHHAVCSHNPSLSETNPDTRTVMPNQLRIEHPAGARD